MFLGNELLVFNICNHKSTKSEVFYFFFQMNKPLEIKQSLFFTNSNQENFKLAHKLQTPDIYTMKTVPSLLVQSPFPGMQISGLNPPVAMIVITHACMWYILNNSLTFACVQSSCTGKGLKLKLVSKCR